MNPFDFYNPPHIVFGERRISRTEHPGARHGARAIGKQKDVALDVSQRGLEASL